MAPQLLSVVSVAAFMAHPLVAKRVSSHMEQTFETEAAGTIYIAGVPVYNYHLARPSREEGGASLLELGEEERAETEVSWNVVMKGTASHEAMHSLCEHLHHGCSFEGNPEEGGLHLLELDATTKELETLLHDGSGQVEFVEPDLQTYVIPELPPSDASNSSAKILSGQPGQPAASAWGLQRIGLSHRNPSDPTGKGVNVYVFDTGVRTTHTDFGGRAFPALEVLGGPMRVCHSSDTSCAMDGNGHGTHCAGTVAGSRYGVAPGATVHSVKVLADKGGGQTSWILTGLDWVKTRAQRPAIVSMSLGSKGQSRAYEAVIKELTFSGIPVVVAAGNDGDDACGKSPAFASHAITVGATKKGDKKASYSNWGSCVNIYAPGSDIVSLSHLGDTLLETKSGTSMACPHVSGAMALLMEQAGNMNTNTEMVYKQLMRNTQFGMIKRLTAADPNKMLFVPQGGSPPMSGSPPYSGSPPQYGIPPQYGGGSPPISGSPPYFGSPPQYGIPPQYGGPPQQGIPGRPPLSGRPQYGGGPPATPPRAGRPAKTLVTSLQECRSHMLRRVPLCGPRCDCSFPSEVPGGIYMQACETWFLNRRNEVPRCKDHIVERLARRNALVGTCGEEAEKACDIIGEATSPGR